MPRFYWGCLIDCQRKDDKNDRTEVRVCVWRPSLRGRRLHEEPAGRQGRQSGRDVQPGHPRSPRVHHHHRGLHRLLPAGRQVPRGRDPPDRRRPAPHRDDHGRALRRSPEPPPGVRALRRPRLHARHDGYGAEPGPQRHHGGGPHPVRRRQALRLRLLPPLRADVRRCGHGSARPEEDRHGPLRADHGRPQGREACPRRPGSHLGGPARAGQALQGPGQGAQRPGLPQRPQGAAHRCHQRRVPFLDE